VDFESRALGVLNLVLTKDALFSELQNRADALFSELQNRAFERLRIGRAQLLCKLEAWFGAKAYNLQ
jgi:hypothetical protein